MDGAHHRVARGLHHHSAVAQGLVVVDDVEAVMAGQLVQLDVGPHAEAQQQRRQGDAGGDQLVEVHRVEVSERVALEEEVALVVVVAPEAVRLQVVADHPVSQGWVGRPGHDVHLVAQACQLAGQVVEVYPLTAGEHVPLVHEKADLHGEAPAERPGRPAEAIAIVTGGIRRRPAKASTLPPYLSKTSGVWPVHVPYRCRSPPRGQGTAAAPHVRSRTRRPRLASPDSACCSPTRGRRRPGRRRRTRGPDLLRLLA